VRKWLGLAIAHKIARLHGGKIDAQSDVSKGVTFSVWLPVSANLA